MDTTLKALLRARHLHSYSDFKVEYVHHARQLGQKYAAEPPTKAQYYKWLSGQLQGLPRGAHCRVLEKMFEGWSAIDLFKKAPTDVDFSNISTPPDVVPRSTSDSVHLKQFFGQESFDQGITLVYPTFQLAANSQKVLADAGISRQYQYAKPNSVFRSSHRIDVPVAVAENDIRPLLYVSALLQRHTTIETFIENDQEVVTKCDRSFISFGLSSNDCTHLYLQQATQPLFSLQNSADGTYLEYLRIVDGSEFRSTDDAHIGIVMRTRPDPILHPDRQWFFCAGLGPQGTAGAGWFLANNWSLLHERAQGHDFIAVVTLRTFSDQGARLVHLYIK